MSDLRVCALCVYQLHQAAATNSLRGRFVDGRPADGMYDVVVALRWLAVDPDSRELVVFGGTVLPVIAVTTVSGTNSCGFHVPELLRGP